MSDDRAWQTLARCRNEDPDSMQPERATTAEVADALMVCNGCPVLEQCAELAAGQMLAYGIHAGRWYGPHPVWEVERTCAHEPCAATFRTEAEGNRTATFCSARCRVAAYRARSNLSA